MPCVLESRDNGFSSEWFTTFRAKPAEHPGANAFLIDDRPQYLVGCVTPLTLLPVTSGPNKVKSGFFLPRRAQFQLTNSISRIRPSIYAYSSDIHPYFSRKTPTMSPPPDARDPPIRPLYAHSRTTHFTQRSAFTIHLVSFTPDTRPSHR